MKERNLLLTIGLDILILVMAVFIALGLRWDFTPYILTGDNLVFAILVIVLLVGSFYFFGVYHRIWLYAGINDFLRIIVAVTSGSVFIILAVQLFFPNIPIQTVSEIWLGSLLLLGGARFLQRLLCEFGNRRDINKNTKKTLIIGAGEAGTMIARTLQSSKTRIGLKPVGFIDDDIGKKGLHLYGLPVHGGRGEIPEVARRLGVDEAIIAIPTATREQIKDIAGICRQVGIKVKILPSVLDIIQGKILLDEVQELKMEDLLHRSEVATNLMQVSGYLKDRVVLVTGAGGSIGAELCRQICSFSPRELILLGRGENSIFEINLELAQFWPKIKCTPIIADVRDEEKLSLTFRRHRPHVVFHAAAHKHVNLMQLHPEEAFKNNVFGTINVARMAHQFKTNIFVLISTDKAVNPSSIMGLTKLLAEMVTRFYAENSGTKFVAVRFGNVLGSRGSVVHLFRKQIAAGGPVTVTDPQMKRYFMTIREAVQLVMQAGALARGGEVFVLDMGEQVKIVDLARDMIRLSGLTPDEDIEIRFIGKKPGEKLKEQLLTASEKTMLTSHNKIYVVEAAAIDYELVNLAREVRGYPPKETLESLINAALTKYNM